MLRVGLLAAMYEATERQGAIAGDGPPVLGDAPISTVGAGKAAGFFARRDIKRRTSCTLASTDGGSPITPSMSWNRSTGAATSHGHVMGDSLPTAGANGITPRRG